MIHLPSGDQARLTWRSSDLASWAAPDPFERIFQTFTRPLAFEVKTISWPSGDQTPRPMPVISNKSSILTGLADELGCELIDLGSVAVRLSGPEDAAKTRVAEINQHAANGKRSFIVK